MRAHATSLPASISTPTRTRSWSWPPVLHLPCAEVPWKPPTAWLHAQPSHSCRPRWCVAAPETSRRQHQACTTLWLCFPHQLYVSRSPWFGLKHPDQSARQPRQFHYVLVCQAFDNMPT